MHVGGGCFPAISIAACTRVSAIAIAAELPRSQSLFPYNVSTAFFAQSLSSLPWPFPVLAWLMRIRIALRCVGSATNRKKTGYAAAPQGIQGCITVGIVGRDGFERWLSCDATYEMVGPRNDGMPVVRRGREGHVGWFTDAEGEDGDR